MLQEQSSNLYITADFKRLNVLLLRFLDEGGEREARKVATATMSAAKVQATLGKATGVAESSPPLLRHYENLNLSGPAGFLVCCSYPSHCPWSFFCKLVSTSWETLAD